VHDLHKSVTLQCKYDFIKMFKCILISNNVKCQESHINIKLAITAVTVLSKRKTHHTLSTLDTLSNRTNANPRDLPVVGSIFRLHSITFPYLEK